MVISEVERAITVLVSDFRFFVAFVCVLGDVVILDNGDNAGTDLVDLVGLDVSIGMKVEGLNSVDLDSSVTSLATNFLVKASNFSTGTNKSRIIIN